ncbi:transcriptional regulator [Flavobacterium akiainvivens]|uniref:Transcriptional regulator n=1 Tax=Flavobacterium akiainvivens TaxID=1202724 RepID=A0A0M9VJV7_9FLAO|nr:AraC family transcriptional regulator [Flavobacterium akiainvivens]KOS08176.1 transcriptional regulator [Flavobacterium akiainvivens]
MERIVDFKSISDYNTFNNHETLHPLVSIVDLAKASPRASHKMTFDIYAVIFKDVKCGDLKYGKEYYDYQEGTLVFFGPGQVIEVESDAIYQPFGHALVFHPDLIAGTSLGKLIDDYTFFSYNTSEALHVSEKERQVILDCFDKIATELERGVDKHSKKLITSNIELLLNYCDRFYDRQFITRDTVNRGIIERFETLLSDFFTTGKSQQEGLPTVSYCAERLHLSPNYFGDLIKKETGRTAQDYIQAKTIAIAKDRVFDLNKSVSEVAYELGFKYPQHFTRLFKQKVGCTPLEYRKVANLVQPSEN